MAHPPSNPSYQALEARVRSVVRRLNEQLEVDGSLPAAVVELLNEVRRTLRASEDRYQRLVTYAGAVVVELLPDGTIVSLNDSVAKVTGFRPRELMDAPWWDKLFPGEYRRELWRLYRRLRRGDVTGYVLRLQNKHLTPVIVEVTSANAYGPGGRLEAIRLFALDLTAQHLLERELERTRLELQEKIWERTDQLERINAELQIEIIEREQFELALKKSEERFRRAVDNIPATVVIYDAERRIRFVNAHALALWDLPEREVLGSRDEELFAPAVTDDYLPALLRAQRTRRAQAIEANLDLRGCMITLMLSFVPLLDPGGEVDEVLGIGYDITERRRIEEDLRLRHDELQTLNHISEIALTRRSLADAYREIVQVVRQAIDSPAVLIEGYDPERKLLVGQAAVGIDGHPGERKLSGLALRAFNAGQIVIERHHGDVEVAVAVPLIVRESVIGLLTASGQWPMASDERLLQWLPGIANTVAIMTDRQRAEEALRESEAQRARAEEFSLLMVARVDLDGRWLRVPPMLCRWLGYSEAELLGLREQDVTHPEDVEISNTAFEQLRGGERRSLDLETRFVTRDGRSQWAYMNVSVLPDAEGRPLLFLVYIRDITEQKRAEEELRLAARVFESSAEAIVILDEQQRIVNVNRAFQETTGYPPDEALGASARLLDSGKHSAEFYRHMWGQVETTDQWQGELWGRRRNGDLFPALLNMGAVRDDRGHIINYVGIFRDITEIKKSQEELERLANFDSLTALPNRNLFHDRLVHGIDRAKRNGSRLAVMFVDLDNFKVINDSLGHDAGDMLLRRVSERLRRSVRSEDTVARVGGDEFVVLLEEVVAFDHIASTAKRINASLFIPMELNGHAVDITGSIGISVFPDDADEVGSLLKNADTAMYVAKEQGRNTYRFFTGGMNQKAIERLSLESSLRRALERDEFFLVYQPQLDLRTHRPVGMEATIRWNHPERGVIGADEFIPVVEASSLSEPIGEWVIRKACEQIRQWQLQGVEVRRVAVNVSARQFRQHDFGERIVAMAEEAGIDPRDLEIELTESAVMQDPEEAGRILHRLKRAGFCIAIDDFGTGYSSLAQLKRFPIDRLKIDRSFVRDLIEDSDDAAISSAIISLAHDLHVMVIAEGVETSAQLDFLAGKGCDEVQGFLFSYPLAAEDVSGFYGHA